MSDTSLKEKTAKGLFWGGFSNGIQQLLNLGFGIVLARLLDASDYGMVGMLTIFSAIAAALQEGGFISALTNRKETLHKDYNAVFWFSLMCSTTIYILLFFAAPLIADFYDTPELIPLSRLSFLGFVISSMSIAPRAYLFKNLRIKDTTVISISSLIVSGIEHHIGGKRIRLLGDCIAKHLFHHRNDGSQFLLLALEALFPVRLYTYQGDDRVQQQDNHYEYLHHNQ